ncbi:MAG: hypothetical protein PHX16_08000 [Syntrophaceticus sp.]|nr:hypothetical protein [Syntrophaceticus sp.]MDD4783554.1 hypothetical protein [Syntrophaceticus sp.]
METINTHGLKVLVSLQAAVIIVSLLTALVMSASAWPSATMLAPDNQRQRACVQRRSLSRRSIKIEEPTPKGQFSLLVDDTKGQSPMSPFI